MSGRYLLDTNILIDLLEGNEAVSGLVDIEEDSELFASVITRMELLAAVRNTKEREAIILSLLSFFTIITLNEDVERKTIAIRRETGLKLPDAIIAASSITTDAVLITRDQRLASIGWPELRVQFITR
jgi:predicted nucleic acid-binding protein